MVAAYYDSNQPSNKTLGMMCKMAFAVEGSALSDKVRWYYYPRNEARSAVQPLIESSD